MNWLVAIESRDPDSGPGEQLETNWSQSGWLMDFVFRTLESSRYKVSLSTVKSAIGGLIYAL